MPLPSFEVEQCRKYIFSMDIPFFENIKAKGRGYFGKAYGKELAQYAKGF